MKTIKFGALEAANVLTTRLVLAGGPSLDPGLDSYEKNRVLRGTLELDSREGVGTTVTLRLVAAPEASQ